MIVTFYSYKGGSGRTQLLANVAAYLCFYKNKKVLLIDWDLEAPGLHYYFNQPNLQQKGLIELVSLYCEIMEQEVSVPENTIEAEFKDKISTFIFKNIKQSSSGQGRIDLMPAGFYDNSYSQKANTLNWVKFYETLDGGFFIELLKKYLKDQEYDYIFIDSRTGVSDYSGICNIQMPDINVIITTPSEQNFTGSQKVIENIINSPYNKIRNNRKPIIIPILSRLDPLNNSKKGEWFGRFRESYIHIIKRLIDISNERFMGSAVYKFIDDDINKYIEKTLLDYKTDISYGEVILFDINKKVIENTTIEGQIYNISEIFEFVSGNSFISPFLSIQIIESKYSTALNLRGKGLVDISSLRNRINLILLDLSDNKISDITSLKNLKSLLSLNLSTNEVKDASTIGELKGLTSLNLSYNQINDFSWLKEIKGLNSIMLSGNNLIDVSYLKELRNLIWLDLSNNRGIKDYSFLKELKAITSLDLSNNSLTDISFLKELKGLTSLNICNNNLSDLSFLKELKGITSLDLSNNSLSDVSFLKELKGLTSLNICNNNLSDVSFLKELKGITSLDLSNNSLTDVSFLKELKGLTSLNISNNRLNVVSFLKELKGLTSLDLSNNNLSSVSFLKELKGITSLYLSGNPIEIPPKEILEKGIEEIWEYFRQVEKYETEKAYEAKILIVGEPGAGKTTLMELLFNESHLVPLPESTQPSTLGVEVKPNRSFKHPIEGLPDIKAHIWDFGGQDIQYMLHQYFLTDDSVYILLTDGRSGKTRYGYWFHIINILGKNSPVLVLLNRRKGQDTVIPFDANLYKESFPKLKIIDLGEIDFGNLNHRWDNLINELAANLSELPIVGQETLKPWRSIREEIERLQPKKHITLDEFKEICSRNGLEEVKEARFLLDYFHKIGVVLNYDEEILQNTVFLDPNWITHAIYDALSDNIIIDKNGQFHKEQLYKHWQEKYSNDIHKQAYTQTECNFLLSLMQKSRLELCYPLENKLGYYIVPMKLPDRRLEYDFETSNSLRFRYQYPFMPEGLHSRLIVRMHEYIADEKVWLTGALFHENGCVAEVLQQETTQEGIKYIGIRISGANLIKRQQFLRNIRREIDYIHRNTFPYIKFSEMVVCNCLICEKESTPNFYAYEDLRLYLKNHEEKIFCTKSRQRVAIRKMIDEVYTPEDFDREGNKKPIEAKIDPKKKTVKIFLASSSELYDDRKEFEIFINRKNKEYVNQGIFLELIIWEDFIDAMSATRLQDEYNKAIEGCDIFVSLFHTKVGKYTNEEFDKAFGAFKANGKPLTFTYFSNVLIDPTKITSEISTLINFKKKLKKLDHFHTEYNNIEDLKYKFGDQLVKILKPPLL